VLNIELELGRQEVHPEFWWGNQLESGNGG